MSSATKIWFLLAAIFLCYTKTIFSNPCGGFLRTMSSAKSLRYPTLQNSWGKVSCEWVIQTASSRRVRLTFTDFVMTTSCCSCERDYLEIRDGLNKSAPLIGRFCAMHFPKVVYSTRENIWIKFESDFMRDINNRFRLSYEAICGQHMVSLSGSFTSPNFPANYNNNLDCIYSIEVPRGRIRVKFESFQIEGRMPVCLDDYLAVRETSGNVVYSQREKNGAWGRKFCGKDITPKVIYSTQSSYFWFHFKTNSFRTSAGFNATYRTVYAGKGSCDGTLTDNEGQIFSENYPFSFPVSKECQWKIKVPEGMHIHLSFLTFNFSKNAPDCSFGRLEVYDGLDLNFKVGRFCGCTLPEKLISRTNEMSLRAVSSNVNHTGWFALQYLTSSEGPCDKTQFTCHDRQCIDINLYCDSVKDCSDGSDELRCSVRKDTFSWYNFWPLSVALVVVLMGLWLWRSWKKFVGSRSGVERNYSHCTPSCHHHNSNTFIAEVTEPPSYNEAVQQGDRAPPSYEEAVAQVQSECITTVDSCNRSSQSQVNIQLDDCSDNSHNSHGSSCAEQFSTDTQETANSGPEQRISQNSVTETRI